MANPIELRLRIIDPTPEQLRLLQAMKDTMVADPPGSVYPWVVVTESVADHLFLGSETIRMVKLFATVQHDTIVNVVQCEMQGHDPSKIFP